MYTLNLTLKPHWENDTVSSVELFGSVEADLVKESSPELDYAEQAFNHLCPFPDYDQLSITDDLGEVPFQVKSAPTEYDVADYLGFYFERPTEGTLRWHYRMFPRVLPDGYRSSPYYDFRNEPFGLNGSGMFTFILPKYQGKIKSVLDWDLSDMPVDARAIWSYGEGRVEREASTWDLRFSLYNVGVMNCYESDDFGVYWFGEPTFEITPAAERLCKVYQYMKEFFKDPDPSFRVFLRRDPFEISNGGSACPHAFISGYSAYGGQRTDFWYCVLVHEMTHSWPYMDDHIAGTGTWFTEGATEFYCTMLPYRAGISDAGYTLDRINEKAKDRYFDNVYREVPNMEIPKIQWKDRRAQTVPYGRGFVYLANVDAKLRRLNKGSLDDLVIGHTITNPVSLDEYRAFIQERLGEEGLHDFEEMTTGKLLVPDPDIFGPSFRTVPDEIELEGKRVLSYHWELAE